MVLKAQKINKKIYSEFHEENRGIGFLIILFLQTKW